MKKILVTITLAAICLAANAQPNQKFVELENYLNELGHGIQASYSQRNQGEGIEHEAISGIWISHHRPHFIALDDTVGLHEYDSIEAIRNKPFIMAVDSIRRTFSELAKTASESYLYEYHRGERDTIKYALAFAKEENDSSITMKHNNSIAFRYFREVGRFNFMNHKSTFSDDNDGTGRYQHIYYDDNPLGLSWEQLKPFDGKEFQRLIEPVLKGALKGKGVKSYPIHWQHDEGYKDSIGGGLQSKTTWYTDRDEENKHTGLTTGTHYVFPKEQEALALSILHQLDSIAFAYVNAHPEQLYTYGKIDRYYHGVWAGMISGSVHKRTKEKAYELKCFLDEDGFHLVSITTIGELWVPKDWQKLKSWVNGKRVELKK